MSLGVLEEDKGKMIKSIEKCIKQKKCKHCGLIFKDDILEIDYFLLILRKKRLISNIHFYRGGY